MTITSHVWLILFSTLSILTPINGAGLWGKDQTLKFPLIVKSGANQLGVAVYYYFNYSAEPKTLTYSYPKGKALLTDTIVGMESQFTLPAWGFQIIEEI